MATEEGEEEYGHGGIIIANCSRSASGGGECVVVNVTYTSSTDDDDVTRTRNYFALLLFLIVTTAIVGNILVCLAVYCKRKLQNMFNYFLVSLAMSDMLSAILVMPLSIMRAAVENLAVPKLMCIAWYSLDVLFTSSTICHLCMISVDRYLTLTYPLRYGHAKKKKHTLLKIAVVWIISFCIAGPLFILSTLDTHQDTIQYKGCGPETPTFVISATVTSFYLPLLIMTVMYALTVRALQQQLHEQRRMTVTNSHSFRSRTSSRTDSASLGYCPSRKASAPNISLLEDGGGGGGGGQGPGYSSCCADGPSRTASFRQQRSPQKKKKAGGSALTVDEGGGGGGGGIKPHSQSLRVKSTHSLLGGSADHRAGAGHSNTGRYLMVAGTTGPWGDGPIAYSLAPVPSPQLQPASLSSKSGGAASNEASTTDLDAIGSQGNLSSPLSPNERTRFRFDRSFTLRRSVTSTGSRRGATSLDKGRRAVQVLGILFAVFVVCYLPFFAVYVVNSVCQRCQPYISRHLLSALEWLAYSGSMLNPIIYHIFNPDFRRAFQNLLSCSCFCSSAARRVRRQDLPICRIDTV